MFQSGFIMSLSQWRAERGGQGGAVAPGRQVKEGAKIPNIYREIFLNIKY